MVSIMPNRIIYLLFFSFIFSEVVYSNEANNSLGYKQYLESVLNKNGSITDKNLEWEIAKQEALNVDMEYLPKLVSQLNTQRNKTPSTSSERQSSALLGLSTNSGNSFYEEKNDNFSVGVEKKIKTGGLFKVSASITDLKNNKQVGSDYGDERKTFLGASFTQPLLKGKGQFSETEVLKSISIIEKDIIYQDYRKIVFDTIKSASDAYWSLYLSQEKRNIRKKSVLLMQKLLKDTQNKIEQGYSARLEHNSVVAALTRRELQLSEAERFVSEQSAMASHLLSSQVIDSKINAQDILIFQKAKYAVNNSLKMAQKNSPSYLALKLKSLQEKIKINYERNKKLPQLDLNLSYGRNGLNSSTVTTSENLHASWYAGLEFSMPLGRNPMNGNERIANLRDKRITSLINNKDYELKNRIFSTVQQLDIAYNDIRRNELIVRQESHILNAFSIEKKSGDRALNSLLQQELELNRAKEDLVTAKVTYHSLLISLWSDEGTLLSKFGLE